MRSTSKAFNRITFELSQPKPPSIKKEEAKAPRHQTSVTPLMRLIKESAPPAPKCFRCEGDWHSWLHTAASDTTKEIPVVKEVGRTGPGEENRGRIKTKEINVEIDYCKDCSVERQTQMQEQKRCNPPPFAEHPLKRLEVKA
jgi:hypothetical protein